jgi:hypothetical protein
VAQQRKNTMRLWLDVSKARYMVTCNPEKKVADLKTGAQKIDAESSLPMWSTELTALTANGAAVIQVTTVSPTIPEVSVGEIVVPEGLEALPWTNKDRDGELRTGIAYRATGLKVLETVGAPV